MAIIRRPTRAETASCMRIRPPISANKADFCFAWERMMFSTSIISTNQEYSLAMEWWEPSATREVSALHYCTTTRLEAVFHWLCRKIDMSTQSMWRPTFVSCHGYMIATTSIDQPKSSSAIAWTSARNKPQIFALLYTVILNYRDLKQWHGRLRLYI